MTLPNSGKQSHTKHHMQILQPLLNPFSLYDDTTKKGSVIIQGMEEVTVHNKNEVSYLFV